MSQVKTYISSTHICLNAAQKDSISYFGSHIILLKDFDQNTSSLTLFLHHIFLHSELVHAPFGISDQILH